MQVVRVLLYLCSNPRVSESTSRQWYLLHRRASVSHPKEKYWEASELPWLPSVCALFIHPRWWMRRPRDIPHSSLIPSKLVCSVFCLPSSPDADMPVFDLSSKLSHQPVLLFLGDPYVLPAASGNQTCHLLTALY